MFDKYPYTDFHELNLDYMLKRLKEMNEEIQAFYEYIDQHFLTSFNGRTGDVVPEAGDYNAAQVTYDNTGSGLAATDVQAAIDEVNAAIPTTLPATDVSYDNTVSGLTATDAQAAIDELAAAPVPDLDDLGDVNITTPANDDVLKYDSNAGEWVNGPGGGGASDLDDLTDVEITTPTNGQVLTYDSNDQKWKNDSASAPSTLGGLSDVTLTTPTDGQALIYDGNSGEWVNGNGGGGSSTLSGLTDVTITTPADGQVLTYDNNDQEWKNAAIPAPAASVVTYDNTVSGLTATNVQDAIDEVAASGGVPSGLMKYEGTDSVVHSTTSPYTSYRSVLWNLRNLMITWFTNHPGKYVKFRYMLLAPNNSKHHLIPLDNGFVTAWDDVTAWIGAANNNSNTVRYSPGATENQNWYSNFNESDGTKSDYSSQTCNNGGSIFFDVFSLTP
jgi:hypothetical protein